MSTLIFIVILLFIYEIYYCIVYKLCYNNEEKTIENPLAVQPELHDNYMTSIACWTELKKDCEPCPE